jgi:N6-L-threonylcarbamoyladenine synthase
MAFLLGIESSCDECSASVIQFTPESPIEVLSLETFSQIALHAPFGGVVPEIASRSHLETINALIQKALDQANITLKDLSAIAVTNRPGLVGSLLVGVSAAKTLSYACDIPLIAIHHIEGHIKSIFLGKSASLAQSLSYPLLTAVVSGGHTQLYVFPSQGCTGLSDYLVGNTLDDSAGEAFDKAAKILGLAYPGGALIEEYAKKGTPCFALPRALLSEDSLDFSFSGLKTAFLLLTKKLKTENLFEKHFFDLCASVQEAILDALTIKIQRAMKKHQCKSLSIVGGVACNKRFAEKLSSYSVCIPEPLYCTDNAAMIAAAGTFYFEKKAFLSLPEKLMLTAYPMSKN